MVAPQSLWNKTSSNFCISILFYYLPCRRYKHSLETYCLRNLKSQWLFFYFKKVWDSIQTTWFVIIIWVLKLYKGVIRYWMKYYKEISLGFSSIYLKDKFEFITGRLLNCSSLSNSLGFALQRIFWEVNDRIWKEKYPRKKKLY